MTQPEALAEAKRRWGRDAEAVEYVDASSGRQRFLVGENESRFYIGRSFTGAFRKADYDRESAMNEARIAGLTIADLRELLAEKEGM